MSSPLWMSQLDLREMETSGLYDETLISGLAFGPQKVLNVSYARRRAFGLSGHHAD
jgi:hypothetical protein